MNNFSLFMPLSKVDEAKREVSGILSAEVPDHASEIMDYESGKVEFEKWSKDAHKRSDGKSLGNIRAMHGNVAAGKLVQLVCDDASKSVSGTAKIVDDAEWNKVVEGVYTGFSIGGSYKRKWKDPDNAELTRFTPVLSEVSIVDNPCVPTATFELIRADGSSEIRKFKEVKKEPEAPEQVWKAADGSTYLTKAEAVAKNDEIAASDDPALLAVKALEGAINKLEGEPKKTPEQLTALKELNKGSEVYDAKCAIDALMCIEQLLSNEEWEALIGKKEEGQIADLKEAVARIRSFIAAEIMETEKVSKAGARHSKKDKAQMDEMKTHLNKIKEGIDGITGAHGGIDKCMKGLMPDEEGEEEKMEESAPVEMTKAVDEEKEELKKKVDFLTLNLNKLTERLNNIAIQPAPAKAALFAVEKGHEVSGVAIEPTTFSMPNRTSPEEARRLLSNTK